MNEVWIYLDAVCMNCDHSEKGQEVKWPTENPSMTPLAPSVWSPKSTTQLSACFEHLASPSALPHPTPYTWILHLPTILSSSEAAICIGYSFISGFLSIPSLENKLSTPCLPLNQFLLKASTSLTLPWSVFWCCMRLNALQHLRQCMKITSWCFCFVH